MGRFKRNAGTLGNRANANIVKEDEPCFLMHVLHLAAGEGGHRKNRRSEA
jgi:hypothetical protein